MIFSFFFPLGWFKRTHVASLAGGFCPLSVWAISLAKGHQTHTHTLMASLEVNVTQGAPTAPGNRFLPHFISLLSPSTLLKRPRSKALWEVAHRPVGVDTEGWWGDEEFLWSASRKRFWLKTHLFHHFISSYSPPWHSFFLWQEPTTALISCCNHAFSCQGITVWWDWDEEEVRNEHMRRHSRSWELSDRSSHIWRKTGCLSLFLYLP